MNRADRLLALARTSPFDRLGSSELMPISAVTRARHFAPGAALGVVGRPLSRLHVVVEGGFEDHRSRPAPHILGLAGVLQDRPQATAWTARTEGATALLVERGHLFTILHACPELALGLADLPHPEHDELAP